MYHTAAYIYACVSYAHLARYIPHAYISAVATALSPEPLAASYAIPHAWEKRPYSCHVERGRRGKTAVCALLVLAYRSLENETAREKVN